MEAKPEWVAPLLRGVLGLVAFALLALAGRRQFMRRDDEPFDSGVD